MLKLSDPVSPIPSEFQVSRSRCRAIAQEFLERQRYDALVDDALDRSNAAVFLREANRLVDSILDPDSAFNSVPPPRFVIDRHVFLEPVRFGRTRLFLSKFIGRIAWRGWVGL